MEETTALHEVVQRGPKRRRVGVGFDGSFSRQRYQLCRATPEVLAALRAGQLCYAASEPVAAAPATATGGNSDKGAAAISSAAGPTSVRICGADRSYRAALRDTSNQLLLVAPAVIEDKENPKPNPNPNSQDESPSSTFLVRGSVGSVIDPEKDLGDLSDLKKLMASVEVTEGEAAALDEARGFDFAAVAERVALSAGELRKGLERLGCLELGGRWRGIAARVYHDVAKAVITDLVASDFLLHAVDVDAVCSHLEEDFDVRLVRHVCHTLRLEAKDGEAPACDSLTSALCPRKTARARAAVLLHGRAGGMDPERFQHAWCDALPGKSEPEPECLEGLVVEVEIPHEDPSIEVTYKRVVLFDEAELPKEPKARFGALFKRKSLWTRTEISPYLAGYGAETAVLKLLAKHAKKLKGLDGSDGDEARYCAR
uniref:Sister chromatid cohesion protein DCC1 n=1 Tax=Phaeomonas parva TaxID=124430 RepID=A0A7S1UAR5_9STRA|mmetsp:Transcript_38945/g.122005  ORF Transcript_38945/g.122005 Transcript_38945/m.122005 type:complete len:428 (+) Transcript_38945:284-1567(+)